MLGDKFAGNLDTEMVHCHADLGFVQTRFAASVCADAVITRQQGKRAHGDGNGIPLNRIPEQKGPAAAAIAAAHLFRRLKPAQRLVSG